jgi:putative membrane protein
MMPWGTGGTGSGLLWWLLVLAFLVAVVAAVVVLLRRVRVGDGGDADDGALDVLRRRYARGEVDDEEFERRRARLEGQPP